MRKLFIILSIAVFTALPLRAEFHTLKCDGLERGYWLHVPEGLPDNAPLVIWIKGYSSNDRTDPDIDRFIKVADREKFVICVPKACGNDKIGYGMNVGYCFQNDDPDMKKVDDVKYLTKLVRYLQKEYNLSRENVFCTGTSNGGEMCYQMAYLKPGFFKAYASQYGLTMTWLYKGHQLKKAVPLCEFHGTEDRVSEWCGDPTNEGGWGEYVSVPLSVTRFAHKAGCTHETCEEIPTVDPDSAKKVLLHKYLGGDDGVEVWLYEIVGAGHGGFFDALSLEECVWAFFKKYID